MSDPILELLAAPPNPSMSLDEHSVYAGGRRRLRRRTLRRTAVGVVGAVGVAAIAFGALGSGAGNDALPAGPSPTAASSGRVSAELLDGRYAVEVIPGAGKDQPNVIFYSITNGRRTQLAGSSASPDVVSLGTGSGADGVMLGTAPADATTFANITRSDDSSNGGGLNMDQQPLPGTDYQAVALDFEKAGGVDSYVDTIWMNAAGEVRNAQGQRLPSVRISATETVFVSHDDAEMGVFMPGGSASRPLGKGESTTLGYGEKPEEGSWSWNSVTLLPEGSRDIKLVWADAATKIDPVIFPSTGGSGVIVVGRATAPVSSAGPNVTSVMWTDSAGTRHTDAVE
ncbi:MAG: hypothetical protein ABIW49_07935 [Knoellia sp.]